MIQQTRGEQPHPGLFLGPMTMDASGKLLRMIGLDAMDLIRRIASDLKVEEKEPDDEGRPDVRTNVDTEAQEQIVGSLQSSFPLFGLIAEEDNLLIPCTHPHMDCWHSVDGADGSRELVRGGVRVATMIAQMIDSTVHGAFIGEPFTERYVYTRTGSHKVHLFDRRNHNARRVLTSITPEQRRPFADCIVLTRKNYMRHGNASRLVIKEGNLVKGWEKAGGSFGSMFIRLWSGEVGALLIPRHPQKPWDWWPVVGISEKLRYRWFYIQSPKRGSKQILTIEEYSPEISLKSIGLAHDVIVLHETHVPALHAFVHCMNAP
jgi:fructose-1,6-bisphosphatase/inositol monophosphatase family enzyme